MPFVLLVVLSRHTEWWLAAIVWGVLCAGGIFGPMIKSRTRKWRAANAWQLSGRWLPVTRRWGCTCIQCEQPAFVYVADKLPGPHEMVTAGQVVHIDGTTIDPSVPLQCDSCHAQLEYGQQAVKPSDQWPELPPYQCELCGCSWPTIDGRELHQCVHGERCANHPKWLGVDGRIFGNGATIDDVAAVVAAIESVQIKRAQKRPTRRRRAKTAA